MGETYNMPDPWGSAAEDERRTFEIEEAHALMPQVRAQVAELVEVRADLAELAADLRATDGSSLGGMPELKALEARLSELQAWFPEQGIEVKGLAPVLLDFPAVLSGVSVRLCWLEGEHELGWYHRTDLGFIARRRLPPTAAAHD
ncbi:DUF2203 domain-containing protein [Salinactinospora qingdaonensis]|uniref:DUF2203 domain-containing protein n=1 Tax=Salinactinospora qingdaonensis TaxID=702744 RepID=A0ABP7ETN2_9ACTN